MINRKLNLSNLKIAELRPGNLIGIVGYGIISGLDLNTKSAQIESFAIDGDNQQHLSEIKKESGLFGCPLWADSKPNEHIFRDFGFILEPKNTFILNHEDYLVKIQCQFATIHAAKLTISYYNKPVLQRLIWYAHELQNGVYYITGKELAFNPTKMHSFNRTRMELKHLITFGNRNKILLLIEPEWN